MKAKRQNNLKIGKNNVKDVTKKAFMNIMTLVI